MRGDGLPIERDSVSVGERLQQQGGVPRHEHGFVRRHNLQIGSARELFAAEQFGEPFETEEGLQYSHRSCQTADRLRTIRLSWSVATRLRRAVRNPMSHPRPER